MRTFTLRCLAALLPLILAAALHAAPPAFLQKDMQAYVSLSGKPTVITKLVMTNGAASTVRTRIELSCDDEALIVAFDCDEADVTASNRGRDDPFAWKDDGVEIFLDLAHSHDIKGNWVHVLVTAAGTIYDERLGDLSYSMPDLTAETTRTDAGWRAVMRLPWAALGGKPEPGTVWGMNLNRTDQPRGEYLCWSPTHGLFHNILQWGDIVFVSDDPADVERGREHAMMQHAEIEKREARRQNYIHAATSGQGFSEGQSREVPSKAEREFRAMIEQRKTDLLASRTVVQHPVMLTREHIARAKQNIEAADWAKQWYDNVLAVADHIVAQDEGYVQRMIPELTPTNPYGITCPNCVGRLSQEGSNAYGGFKWDYREPEYVTCEACGQRLPDAEKFPETGVLQLPRMEQTLTYFLTPAEKANPDDRTGKHAWKWVGHPIHVSFDGIIREKKASFMIGAAQNLAYAYALTDDPRYAQKCIEVLQRYAQCYRNWLYHDYYDGYADCDPMFASWNDTNGKLPMAFKRTAVSTDYEKDQWDSAKMNSNYFGSGRIHPSCDGIANLVAQCQAYDLVYNAEDTEGKSLWTDEGRALVERDLILERIMTGEAWLGGHLEAKQVGNKGGRAYCAVAAVGRVLGLPDYADTALRGYEAIMEHAYLSDGHSRESAFYTFDGFMSTLNRVPEILDGFQWPADYTKRSGTVHVFRDDEKLRMVFRAMHDNLRPNGLHVPFADTRSPRGPNAQLVEVALKYYPELYEGKFPTMMGDRSPTSFAVFELDAEQMSRHKEYATPEVLFPQWKAAMLRHGSGPDAAVLALGFQHSGTHMQTDSLNIYYSAGDHAMLGDQGYISDAPMNAWIQTTDSHNLVIVDSMTQQWSSRTTSLRQMLTSPIASLVEAESNAYGQCSTYRRMLTLIKGPNGATFAVDIFRVKGGDRHDWRAFSEVAASDAAGTARTFTDIDMPAEPALPNFGGSVAKEHIFGLRDTQVVKNPPRQWSTTWKQNDRQYRLHMIADADSVEASNGPGQEDESQTARRVRYIDVIRKGSELSSTFIAVHEPSVGASSLPIRRVTPLEVSKDAGPNAIALRIESDWGDYLLLSEFDSEATVSGVRFQGTFGLLREAPDGTRTMLARAATTLRADELGFERAPSRWAGRIIQANSAQVYSDTSRPKGFPTTPEGVTNYVNVGDRWMWTGYPVSDVTDREIRVERFPLEPASHFELPAVQYLTDTKKP